MLIILIAIGTFITTNIDNLFVLMLLLSQENLTVNKFSKNTLTIILGQYLSFSIILSLSLLGKYSTVFIPLKLLGLLGLLPIFLGIQMLIQNQKKCESSENIKKNITIFNVALLTLANGGDNVGIYTTYFVTLTTSELWITIITFIIMVFLWFLLGFKFLHFKKIASLIEKYGKKIIPFIFILLGIYVLLSHYLFP